MTRTNEKNFPFYKKIGVPTFENLAQQGGFDTYVDLQNAYRYIQSGEIVLEIGAGYGRCIDFLIHKGHKGTIYAIEQSAELCEHLREKYKDIAVIIEGDIYQSYLPERVDSALWMWSGIIDFAPDEQAHTIQHLADLLKEKGKLFIDIPRLGAQTIAIHQDTQHITMKTDFGVMECYIPTTVEVQSYAHAAGFNRVDEINYETSTAKKRTMYILLK